MTIVFASNDIVDFQGASIITDTNDRRTAYVSESFEVANGAGDPLHTSWTTWPEVSGTVTWIHFQGKKDINAGGANADGRVIGFIVDDTGAVVCYVNCVNGAWTLVVDGNSSATFSDPMGTTLRAVDIKIDTASTNTVFEFYVDQVLAKTHTASSTLGNPVAIMWQCYDLENGFGQTHLTVSEFIVADEDTQNFGLSDMTPDAAGNHTAWTGNHVETGDSDLGRVAFVDTTGQKLSSDLSTFNGPSSSALKALVITNRASVRGGTVGDIRNFVRISSTDYNASAALGVGEAIVPLISVFLTNPDTASDWDTTDFSGVEVGVESLA